MSDNAERLRKARDLIEHAAIQPMKLTEKGADILRSILADLERLTAENERLRQVIKPAWEHVNELRDAWTRGAIMENDGGTRSNRNVDVEVALRYALTPPGDKP